MGPMHDAAIPAAAATHVRTARSPDGHGIQHPREPLRARRTAPAAARTTPPAMSHPCSPPPHSLRLSEAASTGQGDAPHPPPARRPARSGHAAWMAARAPASATWPPSPAAQTGPRDGPSQGSAVCRPPARQPAARPTPNRAARTALHHGSSSAPAPAATAAVPAPASAPARVTASRAAPPAHCHPQASQSAAPRARRWLPRQSRCRRAATPAAPPTARRITAMRTISPAR
jgi:hypothetical protein